MRMRIHLRTQEIAGERLHPRPHLNAPLLSLLFGLPLFAPYSPSHRYVPSEPTGPFSAEKETHR
jgi:hypothetical protein